MLRKPMRLLVTAALSAGAFACGTQFGRDAAAPVAFAAEPAASQLCELRIYTAAPGKMDALHARFRDHTLRLFEKHGIKNVGYGPFQLARRFNLCRLASRAKQPRYVRTHQAQERN